MSDLSKSTNTLESHLSSISQDDYTEFLIPEKSYRLFWVMDIVKLSSFGSCCFTKRYANSHTVTNPLLTGNTIECSCSFKPATYKTYNSTDRCKENTNMK